MRPARGFSLIEILIVLFVIVMLTSLVSLNLGGGDGERAQQRKLAALRSAVRYAMDEAQFSGRDFGLLWHFDSGAEGAQLLSFRERLPQGWRPPERPSEALDPIVIDGDSTLTLLLDGVAVIAAPAEAGAPLAGATPQWLFLASGETQAGELLLRNRDSGDLIGRVTWDALGRFELYRGDEQEALGAAQS
jgi:prepilin-type N-terminal cleavage/methylation domain-containing protein